MKTLHLLFILIVITSFDSLNFAHASCVTSDVPCNDLIPNPSTQTPLKQFKSGTDFDDINCFDGFALVQKNENNYPACVKVDSVAKLVSRGWVSDSINRLVIHGLRNVYEAGEKIEATIVFHGLTNGCNFPHVTVLDSNQSTVWKNVDHPMLCITSFGPSYTSQQYHLNSLGMPIILNQTGNYKLIVSYYNMTTEREFNIVPYLR